MPEEVQRYSELITKLVARLAKVWEQGEGEIIVRVTDDKGKKAKISGGETERV